MKTNIMDHTDVLTAPKGRSNAGGIFADTASLKMQLRSNAAMPERDRAKKVLDVVRNEKETAGNRAIAIHSLSRVNTPEAEEALTSIAAKGDVRLAYPAYKALAHVGTAKTFQALAAVKALPYKSLERQKDLAMLVTGYRLQLPGTDEVMTRMLKDTNDAPRMSREFPLKFQAMKADELAPVLKQVTDGTYGMVLSNQTGYKVLAGGHEFYFCFNSKFETPAAWDEVTKNKQVIGMLFRKDPETRVATPHSVALATPGRGTTQLSFFKSNGELFMLANADFDLQKRAFSVANVREDTAKEAVRSDLKADQNSSITMNLSYIQRHKKQHGEAI